MAVALLDSSANAIAQSTKEDIAARGRLQYLLPQTMQTLPPARLLPAQSKVILLQSRI